MDVGDRVITGVPNIGWRGGVGVRVEATGTIANVEVAETFPSIV